MIRSKRILLVSDFHANVYAWRKEIVDELRKKEIDVALAVPYGERLEYFKKIGCSLFDLELDRYSLSISSNIQLLFRYKKILEDYRPDIVLLYGTKGMLYSGLFCKLKKIKYITNINGFGTLELLSPPIKMILILLYRIVVPGSYCVFFQNEYNMKRFKSMGIVARNNRLIPGSGVNTDSFGLLPFPEDETVNFLFCARLTKEKGIYEFVNAAKELRDAGLDTSFSIVGMGEQSVIDDILKYKDYVRYFGFKRDVRPFMKCAQCVVLPSYYGEGISNSLLESASSGRPIITSDMPGCRETVEEGKTGYIIKPKDSHLLADSMRKFCELTRDQRIQMGLLGRKYVEHNFSREVVVKAYLEEIDKIFDS